ncbi:GGDEF domain-containing protein [Neptunicella marina]|uniref:diguanylate cyclase n=1 Tax=Neptunicella marina TaxID=2125989 RepID=A0A8J6ISZ3_9ALTE|nr:GGDEF domain-containing protein [Neptunicella marina]MBC3765162.1 GGDEF domain-containing protein [Neptunicella marina]
MPVHLIKSNNQFQNSIQQGLAITIGILAILLSLANLTLGQYPLMVLEWMLAACCFFVYRQIKINKFTYIQSLLVPYLTVVAIIFGTLVSKLVNGLFIWTFIVPTIFYLLFGQRHGFWATLVIGVIQVINILNKENVALYNSDIVAINFACAYFAIWLVSRTYEINRSKSQQALQQLAMKDSLTGAYNRLALKKFFEEQSVQSKELTLVLIDIDYFKAINDDYGHEAGDHLLTEFTHLLQKKAGESQVFRLGGEEFCLLLPLNAEQAVTLTNDVRQHMLQAEFLYKKDSFHFTFSAGIAAYKDNRNLSDLLADADKKLYRAKRDGRNQVID